MFYDKVSNLCKQNKTTITRMCTDIGLSNAVATGWKTGSTPKLDTVRRIANHFGVPMEDLLSEDNTMSISATGRSVVLQGNQGNNTVAQGDIQSGGEQLSDMELELLRIFRKLDMRKKNALMSQAFDMEDSMKEV